MSLETKLDLLCDRITTSDICDMYNHLVKNRKSIFIIEININDYDFYPSCFKVGHLLEKWLKDVVKITYKAFLLPTKNREVSKYTIKEVKKKIKMLLS